MTVLLTDVVPPGQRVTLEIVKWPDLPHHLVEMRSLGQDRDGHWLWAPAGTPVQSGTSVSPMPCDFLTLVPAGQWWMATWMIDAEHELYVDIATPAVWGPGAVRVVDLDLDIQRWPDGRVELLDEDEFEERQYSLGYPSDVLASARHSAEVVLRAVSASSHPFGPAPTVWLQAVPRR